LRRRGRRRSRNREENSIIGGRGGKDGEGDGGKVRGRLQNHRLAVRRGLDGDDDKVSFRRSSFSPRRRDRRLRIGGVRLTRLTDDLPRRKVEEGNVGVRRGRRNGFSLTACRRRRGGRRRRERSIESQRPRLREQHFLQPVTRRRS